MRILPRFTIVDQKVEMYTASQDVYCQSGGVSFNTKHATSNISVVTDFLLAATSKICLLIFLGTRDK